MMKNKYTFGTRTKLFALLGACLIIMGLGYQGAKATASWFDKNQIVFNRMVEVKFQTPVEIKQREVEVQEIVKVIGEVPHPDDLVTDTEKYIYEVFGIEDYKIAIAIAKAESGLKEDAININTNGSVDIGVFQINSVHFSKEGCSLKDVATVKGNVDCAYQIYQASGWNPWVGYTNGNFLSHLD